MRRLRVNGPGIGVASPMALVCMAMGPVLASSASAQESSFSEAVEANTHVFDTAGADVGGPGLDFVIQAVADARFVAFAEPHNVREVPQWFTTLFKALHQTHGFNHAALEAGPVIMEMASSQPVRGDLEALRELYARYPSSFTWNTDQELEMIAEIGAMSTAETPPVWGLDQVFGTLHILDELHDKAPGGDTREYVEEIAAAVRETYFSRVAHQPLVQVDTDVFANLRARFSPEPNTRSAFLMDQLELSHRVYRGNILAGQGQLTGYRSNAEREDNMKALFMRRYREAQDAGDAHPKVMLKFGHWHLMKGVNPGNVYTLGNFIMEVAASNGTEAVIIAATVVNEPGVYWSITDSPEYGPISRMGSPDRTVIVDTRPLRAHVHARGAGEIHPSLHDWIFKYDAVLLIGGATRGTYEFERQRMRDRRRGSQ